MQAEEPCQLLSWDTEFFGFRIAKIHQNRLNSTLASQILSWSHLNEIECLYFLADSDDAETIRIAEEENFNLTDIRLTMEFNQSQIGELPNNSEIVIRSWNKADLPFLQNIAKTSFHMTRFYYDRCFSRSSCDALYETWIRKSCEGFSDFVMVAEWKSIPSGFITCNSDRGSTGSEIGLLGVAKDVRNQGIGKLLVNHALKKLISQDNKKVQVVTQGRNIASQRLYQRCGFFIRNVQIWYHKWLVTCR